MVSINCEILPDFSIGDDNSPIIHGILNLSPESFYKGSIVKSVDFKEKVDGFIKNGAKILDLGARSTAPGVIKITKEEELERIKPFLEKTIEIIPKKVVLSIDTMFSSIAEYCMNRCIQENVPMIINDVSGLKSDPKMIDLITDNDLPLILMASRHVPGDILSVNSILESIFESILELERKNYNLSRLIIDPGIGKWIPEKTFEYDLSIIDNLERFRAFGQPILVGISRKSFIGSVLNKKDPSERLNGTLAATVIAVYNGAHVIRTHDVTPNLVEMITMAKAIRKKPLIVKKDGIIGGLLGSIKESQEARFYQRLKLSVTPAGARIMDKKMVTKLIQLDNITAPQSMILKQELLARGGDVAIHKDAISTENAKYERNQRVVLIGTEKQLYSLAEKLKGQQLELDKISSLITEILEKSLEDKYLHSM